MSQVSDIIIKWTPETSGRVSGTQIQSRLVGTTEWTEIAAAADPTLGVWRFGSNAPNSDVEVRIRNRMVSGVFGAWTTQTIRTSPVTVAYVDLTGTPSKLSDINSGEGSKLGGIDANATSGDSLLPREGWTLSNFTQPEPGVYSANYPAINGYSTATPAQNTIRVQPGETLYVSYRVNSAAGVWTGLVTFGYDANLNYVGYEYAGWNDTGTGGVWRNVDFVLTIPANVVQLSSFYIRAQSVQGTGAVTVRNFRIARTQRAANVGSTVGVDLRNGATILGATDVVTIQGVAGTILYQGSGATANNLSQLNPAEGAKLSNTSVVALSPIGQYSTVSGNAVYKIGGTHGAFEGGAVGTALAGSGFISSSLVYPGGGWNAHWSLSTDRTAIAYPGTFGMSIGTSGSPGTATGTINLTRASDGAVVSAGLANLDYTDRFSLRYDGVSISAWRNGVKLLSLSAPKDLVVYPKVLDFFRGGDQSPPYAFRDVQYGLIADANLGKTAEYIGIADLPRAQLNAKNLIDLTRWRGGEVITGNSDQYAGIARYKDNNTITVTSGAGPQGRTSPIARFDLNGDYGGAINWTATTGRDGYDLKKTYRIRVWVMMPLDKPGVTWFYRPTNAVMYGANGDYAISGFGGAGSTGGGVVSQNRGNWYLVAVTVHGSTYTGPETNTSGIWNSDGQKVESCLDWKSQNGQTWLGNHVQAYTGGTGAIIYAEPVIEEIGAGSQSIAGLFADKLATWNGTTGEGKPADYATSDIALIATGGATVTGNSVAGSGVADWTSGAYSKHVATAGAAVTAIAGAGAAHKMLGLTTIDAPGPHFANHTYAIYYIPGGNYVAIRGGHGQGANVNGSVPCAIGDVLEVISDDANVSYYVNGTLIHRHVVNVAGERLRASMSFHAASSFDRVTFNAGVSSNDFTNIGGPTKPEANATNGAKVGINVRRGNNALYSVDELETSLGTAAYLKFQGALATSDKVRYTDQVLGLPRAIQPNAFFQSGYLKASEIYHDAGIKNLSDYFPAEVGADKTTNQPVVSKLNASNGTARDGRLLSTGLLVGQTSAVNAYPSSQDQGGGSGVTITIPAHVRTIPVESGQLDISYNSGSVANLAYSTYYDIYTVDPNFAGGGVTYFVTTNPKSLVGMNVLHVSSIFTPAQGQPPSSGTGGGGGGGGGTRNLRYNEV